jgi:hypothetical protein
MSFDIAAMMERIWRRMPHVFYHAKTNTLVCCEFQRWVGEGNKIMVSINSRDRCIREDIFLKNYEYIGDMGYENTRNNQ